MTKEDLGEAIKAGLFPLSEVLDHVFGRDIGDLGGSHPGLPDSIADGCSELSVTIETASENYAKAIYNAFVSPNESDSNLEPANVVDALFFVGRAGCQISDALNRIADAIEGSGMTDSRDTARDIAITSIADAIREHE